MKTDKNDLGHKTKLAAIPINGKNLLKSSSRDPIV